MQLIYRVKRLVPNAIWNAITSPYWLWHNRARHQVAALLSNRLSKSQAVLASYKDRHAGERCFILGNGPSLRHTDLRLLQDEITFGMNRVYLLFDEIGFKTTYYLAVNTLVIEQCADEIVNLVMPKFITWRGRSWFQNSSDVIFIDTDYTKPDDFSGDVSGRVFEGSTVTYVALQLAFHMGFSEVVLIGVDHRFKTQGKPNLTVVSDGDDEDHFAPAYFGKGFRWQLPDLDASERAYELAKQAFIDAGREVVDATIGGNLKVFPKVDYEKLFDHRSGAGA
jgi:hypothetical protein